MSIGGMNSQTITVPDIGVIIDAYTATLQCFTVFNQFLEYRDHESQGLYILVCSVCLRKLQTVIPRPRTDHQNVRMRKINVIDTQYFRFNIKFGTLSWVSPAASGAENIC